jgi:hypothetical protein
MHCCSCWIASTSCATCFVTWSSTFISRTVTNQSDLLTASFTSSCSASNCSFPYCICVFSSSNFAYRAIFSYSTAWRCSTSTPCTCIKAWVACSVSSCAWRRRTSTISDSQWSWASSSPNSGSPGAVETAWLD